jgi:hypothetical protein
MNGVYKNQRALLRKTLCSEGINLVVDCVLSAMIVVGMWSPCSAYYFCLKIWYLAWITTQASGQMVVF